MDTDTNPYVVPEHEVRRVKAVSVVRNHDDESREEIVRQHMSNLYIQFEQYEKDIMTNKQVKDACNADRYCIMTIPKYNVEKKWNIPPELKAYKDRFDQIIDEIPPSYCDEVLWGVQNYLLDVMGFVDEYWPVQDLRDKKVPRPWLEDLKVMMLICLLVGVQYNSRLPKDADGKSAYDSDVTVGGAEEEED